MITKLTTLNGDVVYDLTRNPPILLPKFAIGQRFDLNGAPCEIIGIDSDTLYEVRCKNIVFTMNKAQLSDLKLIDNE